MHRKSQECDEYNLIKDRKSELLKFYHDVLGHTNYEQTLMYIQQSFIWDNMKEEVKEYMYVNNCTVCAERKQGNHVGNKRRKHFGATKPFEKICIDITGPLPKSDGYSYILGIIDVFSRYAMLIPLKK